MVGESGFFFVESENAFIEVRFNHAELMGVLSGHGDGGDRAGSVGALVIRNHVRDVHPVNVIGAENCHDVRPGLLDEIDVLINGVGGSLIPVLAWGAHLGGDGNDELVLENAPDLPALIEVLQEALAAELGQYVDRVNTGVDEVAENEIDDPVFSAKWNGWLGAFLRQWIEPGPLTAGEDNSEHAQFHGRAIVPAREKVRK